MGIKKNYFFELMKEENNIITFKLENENLEAKVSILEEDIVRVTFVKNNKLRLKNTWIVAPGQEDVAFEGRDKFDYSLYTLPTYKFSFDENAAVIETKELMDLK